MRFASSPRNGAMGLTRGVSLDKRPPDAIVGSSSSSLRRSILCCFFCFGFSPLSFGVKGWVVCVACWVFAAGVTRGGLAWWVFVVDVARGAMAVGRPVMFGCA